MTKPAKDALREAYIEGYKAGKGVESVPEISIQTATRQFDRWYQLHTEQ